MPYLVDWCDLSLKEKVILVLWLFGRLKIERLKALIFLNDRVLACGKHGADRERNHPKKRSC